MKLTQRVATVIAVVCAGLGVACLLAGLMFVSDKAALQRDINSCAKVAETNEQWLRCTRELRK